LGALHELWQRFGDKVEFAIVYIREAHPEDGWVVTPNRSEDIAVNDPTSDEEREEVAATCALRLKIRMPVVVDRIDDAIARAYGALPDRLYLIGRGGVVKYQGGPGPFGFKPDELEAAIQSELSLG
jgi:hypothetical protein